MQIHRSATELVVQAPAKLNLFFEVLAKRDDGYHEIESLMCPIDLFDTLFCREERSGQVSLQCERASDVSMPNGSDPVELPRGRQNLVVRAVELLRRECGVRKGLALRLVKRIPLAAGLGGGSSDAAAALAAANNAWSLGLSRRELAVPAAQLGSDVPFFLADGPAVCRGRGEQVQPVTATGVLNFVVVCPPQGLSTAAVYAACRPAQKPRSSASLLEAFSQGNAEAIGRLLWNRLQPAAEQLSPWIERLQAEFARHDFLGSQMTGSGTSYFGLCRHPRHARRVAERLEANGAGSVFVVQTCR